MPIPLKELKKKFIVFSEADTVQTVRDRINASGDLWAFIIVQLGNGRYAVFYLANLIDALVSWRGKTLFESTLATPLGEIPGFLAELARPGYERENYTVSQALREARPTPGGRFIVVLDGDTVVGLLSDPYRISGTINMRWLDQTPVREVMEETPPETTGSLPSGLGTLSGEEPTLPPLEPDIAPRIINTELRDEDGVPQTPKTQPLKLATTYLLSFFVDAETSQHSITPGMQLSSEVFRSGEQVVGLDVRLESDDFDIEPIRPRLDVPRTGKSSKATFEIRARKEGVGIINAVFLKEGNFVQLLTLKFVVGELFTVTAQGRDLSGVAVLKPRDVNLTIVEETGGFRLILTGPVAATCKLPVTLEYLNHQIALARKEMLDIVHAGYAAQNLHVFQAGIDIPEDARDFALQKLAKAGYLLFDNLFFGPETDTQTQNLGNKLRQMAQSQTLNIQIFSEKFVLPWGILYMADSFIPDQPVIPDRFLGFKHIIEHIPLQQTMGVTTPTMDGNGLHVGLSLNKDIEKPEYPIITEQLDYWKTIQTQAGVMITEHATRPDLLTALARADLPDNILYFYCHAVSKFINEKGGPDASHLLLTGNQSVTIEDLKLYTKRTQPLPGAPLVFLNACESAELSPLFYDGFVPYFMQKGARGVIGTECETPALFGVVFAKRFFDEFLNGKRLGEVMLDLRREFLNEHNNPLGLLYALYVDGDTVVEPGLNLSF
ncbi:MAG TPA: CHAT domain-containing protein [Anaerolineales bacterium]|nr:CHAT domain-containing protein [Anaerolineales bacterium]